MKISWVPFFSALSVSLWTAPFSSPHPSAVQKALCAGFLRSQFLKNTKTCNKQFRANWEVHCIDAKEIPVHWKHVVCLRVFMSSKEVLKVLWKTKKGISRKKVSYITHIGMLCLWPYKYIIIINTRYILMLKCTSNHTYQISWNPPVLRAMLTSSLPYFSSADALQTQSQRQMQQKHVTMMSLSMCMYWTVNKKLWVHLIFMSSSMSLHVRRPSLSLWIIVSYPMLLMKSVPCNNKYGTVILNLSVIGEHAPTKHYVSGKRKWTNAKYFMLIWKKVQKFLVLLLFFLFKKEIHKRKKRFLTKNGFHIHLLKIYWTNWLMNWSVYLTELT